jgi:hypothetical protein
MSMITSNFPQSLIRVISQRHCLVRPLAYPFSKAFYFKASIFRFNVLRRGAIMGSGHVLSPAPAQRPSLSKCGLHRLCATDRLEPTSPSTTRATELGKRIKLQNAVARSTEADLEPQKEAQPVWHLVHLAARAYALLIRRKYMDKRATKIQVRSVPLLSGTRLRTH